MNHTPNASKMTVCIFGKCNSGKSSLFNSILGSNTAIVSNISGTTTDPVVKSMELLPHGPIVLIDTAGVEDYSDLGNQRMKKTESALNRADFALYVSDYGENDFKNLNHFISEFKKRKTPFIHVITKKDLIINSQMQHTAEKNVPTIRVSIYDHDSINQLKTTISECLDKLKNETIGLITNLLEPKSIVILVIPIDSESPKGRLILPQVQLIRECLDNDIRCNITTIESLNDALGDEKKVDLVITDSQAFKEVSAIVPKNIPLTSFSILTARQKGDLSKFIDGSETIKLLKDDDKILIAEACTHSVGHEDIGKIKIPIMLKKITGKSLDFIFVSGHDYPEDLSIFALIIHCGGCMITKKEMTNRILAAEQFNIPITNYGIIIAYCNGVLDRSVHTIKQSLI